MDEERETCEGCGQPREVCMDPATQHTWRIERHTCEACRVLEAEVENDAEGSRPRGRKYRVQRSE